MYVMAYMFYGDAVYHFTKQSVLNKCSATNQFQEIAIVLNRL